MNMNDCVDIFSSIVNSRVERKTGSVHSIGRWSFLDYITFKFKGPCLIVSEYLQECLESVTFRVDFNQTRRGYLRIEQTEWVD